MSTKLDETLAFELTKTTPVIRFVASLSDGRTVIEDVRASQRTAWARLTQFIKANPQVQITCLRLQGPRGKEIVMPSNQNGYCFGYKHRKVHPGGETNFVGIGYYDGHKVLMRWFKTPNLDYGGNQERTKESAGFLLIENSDEI
jgi:hypothetical protein